MIAVYIIVLVVCVLVATIGGYSLGHRERPQIENIDYKQRWLSAVELLGGDGRLSADEVKSITDGKPEKKKKGQHNGMTSYHRYEIAIARAKAGLPDDDDLSDMTSYHKAEVIKARIKYASRSLGQG